MRRDKMRGDRMRSRQGKRLEAMRREELGCNKEKIG